MKKPLSPSGREQVALALLLLRDFKAEGAVDIELILMIHELADNLGVRKEFDSLISKVPRMKITPA